MAFMAPGGTIEMSRELYRRMWNDDRVNRIWLRVTPGVAPEVVRGLIASRLGTRYRLQVLSSGEMREHLVAHVRRAFAPIDVLLAIVLLVMLIGLADVLAAGVAQRTRELGMLRAVGVPRRAVALMVLIEGTVLGGLGLLLAAVLGLALGMLWVTVILPDLLGWTLEPHAPQARLVTLGALTLLVGFLAGWLPARRAAAHQPAVALRYD
jgi:putative ABC transport system permease protein